MAKILRRSKDELQRIALRARRKRICVLEVELDKAKKVLKDAHEELEEAMFAMGFICPKGNKARYLNSYSKTAPLPAGALLPYLPPTW